MYQYVYVFPVFLNIIVIIIFVIIIFYHYYHHHYHYHSYYCQYAFILCIYYSILYIHIIYICKYIISLHRTHAFSSPGHSRRSHTGTLGQLAVHFFAETNMSTSGCVEIRNISHIGSYWLIINGNHHKLSQRWKSGVVTPGCSFGSLRWDLILEPCWALRAHCWYSFWLPGWDTERSWLPDQVRCFVGDSSTWAKTCRYSFYETKLTNGVSWAILLVSGNFPVQEPDRMQQCSRTLEALRHSILEVCLSCMQDQSSQENTEIFINTRENALHGNTWWKGIIQAPDHLLVLPAPSVPAWGGSLLIKLKVNSHLFNCKLWRVIREIDR